MEGNLQVDYDKTISNSIQSILACYESAPIEVIDKYSILFSYLLERKERKPINNNRFTFYPSVGRIISFCGKHVIQLSPIQAEIFYLLAKSLTSGRHIDQEVLYNFVYENNFNRHHTQTNDKPLPDTLKTHIYKLNVRIHPLNLMIRHKMGFGWAIRTEKSDILQLNDTKCALYKGRSY